MRNIDVLTLIAAKVWSLENYTEAYPTVGNWGCTLKRKESHRPPRSSKTVSRAENRLPLFLLPGSNIGQESQPRKNLSLAFRESSNKKIHIGEEKTGPDPNYSTYIPPLDLPVKKRKLVDDNGPNLLPESAPDVTNKKRKIGFKVTRTPTLDLNKTPKIRKFEKFDDNGPEPPPDLPDEFRDKISERAGSAEVENLVLVIQKRVTNSDLQENQNRFSIPTKKMRNEFLGPEDVALLKQRKDNGKCKVLSVGMIEPQGEVKSVNLTRWEMKKEHGKPSVSYVLNGDGWKNTRDGNELKVGDVVQLWSVTMEGKPCLIFVKL